MAFLLPALLLLGSPASAIPTPQSDSPSAYPPGWAVPPTDSAIVQQYIAQIDWNWVRNNISQTTSQYCDPATDPESVALQWENCWWSCNQCRWESDVYVCPTKGEWGLTFDDGPTAATPELLDELASDGTTATFFVTGTQILLFPDTLRRIANEGHEIGIHTWSHAALTTLSSDQIVAELGWTLTIIADTLGYTPSVSLFRPPYGDVDNRVRDIAAQLALTPALWSHDTNDWKLNEDPANQPMLEGELDVIVQSAWGSETGIVTLQHDSTAAVVRYAIDVVLPRAKEEGFTLQSLASCRA
ncbi:unnamed protein product [Zymoseptoria tritici ST99CH_3D7]|uniref:chitin deacetylase n=1 Tax=Zymoseptoria tritici (strain ST99CH_3D7) TaxID=1276538 RepID=A0A1X7S0W0_ZYMT9|nr:unnamed protein product [Zymoseptoria tritici ST99CH_3D7]